MSGSTGGTTGQTVQSVERAFRMIEILGDGKKYGVSEVADELDMPTSNAHVYLKTLAETGYVVRDGKKYRLGFAFLRQGGVLQRRCKAFRVARPYLQRLADDVSEFYTVTLGVHENGKRVLIGRYDGQESPFRTLPIGQYAYMHNTATGKAMLATMTDEDIDRIVELHGLPSSTPKTITTREELFDEVSKIRERGYSTDYSESAPEQRAVGVAIHDGENGTVGSISVGGPKPQIDDAKIESLAEKIQDVVSLVEIKYQQESADESTPHAPAHPSPAWPS